MKLNFLKKNEPVYIREVMLQFKDKPVDAKFANTPIVDPDIVYELFSDLKDNAKETLLTISLDKNLKIICFEVVAIGGNAIANRPFEAIRASIPINAYGIILVHNHPNGDPIPDKEDLEFTKELLMITKIGGMDFHDHIIIGKDSYHSINKSHGMEKLYEQRKEEERAIGRQEEKIAMARALKSDGVDVKIISKASGLLVKEIEEL